MVRLALVVALLAAGGVKPPPAIHEPFTPLPCPIRPDTAIEVEGCQEMRILRTDRAIDVEARAIFRLLRTERARESFVTEAAPSPL